MTKKPKKKRRPTRKEQLDALKLESERNLIELIRRLQALPMNKRTNFLRVRKPFGRTEMLEGVPLNRGHL